MTKRLSWDGARCATIVTHQELLVQCPSVWRLHACLSFQLLKGVWSSEEVAGAIGCISPWWKG